MLEDEEVQQEAEEMARRTILRAGRRIILYRLAVGVAFILGAAVVGFFVDRFWLGRYFFSIFAPLMTLLLYIRELQSAPSIQQTLQEMLQQIRKERKI